MTTIPYCLIKPEVADALRALARTLHLDIPKRGLGFLCPGCKHQVQPVGDHFEHLKANPNCPLM